MNCFYNEFYPVVPIASTIPRASNSNAKQVDKPTTVVPDEKEL